MGTPQSRFRFGRPDLDRDVEVLGRLHPGVSTAAAGAELETIRSE